MQDASQSMNNNPPQSQSIVRPNLATSGVVGEDQIQLASSTNSNNLLPDVNNTNSAPNNDSSLSEKPKTGQKEKDG